MPRRAVFADFIESSQEPPKRGAAAGGGAKMPVNCFFQFVIFRTSSCGFHHDSAMLIYCSPATKLVPFTVAQLGKTTAICEKIR
jgi:hypothetical protein